MGRRAILLAGLASVLAFAVPTAEAKGQLQARPTLVELVPGATAGRMTLANTGDAPVSAQVRVFAWTQEGGDDRLLPTRQIALSPPIIEIAPGTEQVVRVVRLGIAPSTQDQNYRLIVEELPAAEPKAQLGVNFRMRYVLPMFVRATGSAAPSLRCQLEAAVLSCDNSGGRAAQLGTSRLIDAAGKRLELSPGLFGYVLGGSHRQWHLDPGRLASLASNLQLQSQLNGQPVVIPVARVP